MTSFNKIENHQAVMNALNNYKRAMREQKYYSNLIFNHLVDEYKEKYKWRSRLFKPSRREMLEKLTGKGTETWSGDRTSLVLHEYCFKRNIFNDESRILLKIYDNVDKTPWKSFGILSNLVSQKGQLYLEATEVKFVTLWENFYENTDQGC